MSLPADKVAELKEIIHNQLEQIGIHGRIQECLSDSIRKDDIESSNVTEEGLLKTLKERGIVDDVLRSIQFRGLRTDKPDVAKKGPDIQRGILRDPGLLVPKEKSSGLPLDPAKRYIYLQALGGRAFLEHLQDPEPIPGVASSTISLHVHFRGQQFLSKPVPCACEPAIQEGFLLEVQKSKTDGSKMSDAPSLLSISDSIHLVLVKHDLSGDSVLLSSLQLEWRKILTSPTGSMKLALELNGIGTGAKVPVGLLDVKLEVIPRFHEVLVSEVVSGQLNLEKGRIAERDRLFLVYAKQWWQEYLQIRGTHNSRLVKIFAQDENGLHRFTCSYVQVLRAGRLLDTPRQAARFVSLLSYEKAPSVGGQRSEIWTSLHAFLSRRKGDIEDHACLLCSLLLGFGLNAYVCVGTKTNGMGWAWVVTISSDGAVIFWDSLTAQRFVHQYIDPDNPPVSQVTKTQHSYKTIGCVFNHQEFYANSQPTDSVAMCNFNLCDESLWKCMNKDAVKSVCGPGLTPRPWPAVVLLPSNIDAVGESNRFESDLRALITQHRAEHGLSTVWDDELSYMLSPSLAAYELENTHGLSVGNEEFQHAIRRYIPDGHTFKGFPIQFVHCNARKALAVCLRSSICEDIINCKGDQVRLAIRARVYTYPENVCAVWIMFAARYRSVL